MNLPYIIAEAGSCHEEMLPHAIQLIQVAAECGADAVKFQYWGNKDRMRSRRHLPFPAYEVGSINYTWFPTLKDVCKGANIAFACSVYLPEDVPVVSEYVDVFKVSSFEARDRELTAAVSAIRGERPFFISTGMQEATDDGTLPKDAIYLHCVSAYPCPFDEANLGAIEPHEGYSDHTRLVDTGGLAVAAGADYLEVHFRLSLTTAQAPDYPVSLNPSQLLKYVRFARTAAMMRGDGIKRVMPSEQDNLKYRVIS